MKLLLLLPVIVLFSYCGTPRKTHAGSDNPTTRAMKTGENTGATEEVVITGSQYIPVEGRNEVGVSRDLEGTWMLESGLGATNTNNLTAGVTLADNTNGKEYSGTIIADRMKNSTEVRRDSVVTTSKNGVKETSTTVYLINKDGEGNKITPPQSSNPNVHIPERPSLRFYGSNETFSGFTGCNKMSGRYTVKGNTISFQNAAASTKMVCIGDFDENEFLELLHQVNTFKSVNGQLQLLNGDKVLLTFSKK